MMMVNLLGKSFRSLYSYSENHGVVSDITIILSTAIAQSLTVTVSGGNNKCTITV